MTTNFFSPMSFIAVFGSGMGKNQDPGSGINIPDPPHCTKGWQHCTRRRRAHQQRAPPAPQPGPDGGLQQDQHCRHHEHAGTYLNRLGTVSVSGLDPNSIRSVDPDGGLQQDQHCRHHEHAGTY
jgi:hypothetical protein